MALLRDFWMEFRRKDFFLAIVSTFIYLLTDAPLRALGNAVANQLSFG